MDTLTAGVICVAVSIGIAATVTVKFKLVKHVAELIKDLTDEYTPDILKPAEPKEKEEAISDESDVSPDSEGP